MCNAKKKKKKHERRRKKAFNRGIGGVQKGGFFGLIAGTVHMARIGAGTAIRTAAMSGACMAANALTKKKTVLKAATKAGARGLTKAAAKKAATRLVRAGGERPSEWRSNS